MRISQFPATVDLTSLNGITGFVLPGKPGEYSGNAVSRAGDVNGDGIEDLLIGASQVSPDGKTAAGCSYIVFGNSGIGNSGSFALSTLNGINGFALPGVAAGDQSGFAVSNLGDINGDGLADIAIGAPYAFSNLGATYVVFGQVGIGKGGSLSLSSLNGTNGFSIPGILPNGQNGWAISTAGDINADGLSDFAFLAPQATYGMHGLTYILFGNREIGLSGSFNLAAINGTNGFTLPLIGANSISGGQDINGDGIADLIIGEPLFPLGLGVSYVVFGGSGIGSSGTFNLLSLNGTNGFTIQGSASDGLSGYLVSFIGDVNDDGLSDLALGAPQAFGGISYVVFGKIGIGSSGVFNLANLNGTNGFVIPGVIPQGYAGIAISGAGDINGDEIVDLIIGSPVGTVVKFGGSINNMASSYVVFGNKVVGNSGTINLLSLDGENGFAVPGVSLGDLCGYSVSGIGDINADGMADIVIGSPQANTITSNGASYVIFGDPIVKLLVNQITIQKGHTALINGANLNATSIKFPSRNPAIIFSISNVQHGQFEQVTQPGLPITSFIQQQILGGQIQFVHDDSLTAPSYDVTVGDGGITAIIPPQAAAIIFIHQGPRLVTNVMQINQGQTIALTSSQLSAIDLDNPADYLSLIFAVSVVRHGQFAFTYSPSVAISSFSQDQLQTANVQFTHDGTINAPAFNITVSDGGITTVPQACIVSFNLPPILINNTLNVNQGQVVILTGDDLSATDPDDSASSLIFQVSNVAHGYFENSNAPGTVITSFTQAQVQQNDIEFIPVSTSIAPSYNVAVSDGKVTIAAQPSKIIFNFAPVLVNNTLQIQQGESLVLSTSNLSATDADDLPGNLVFIISQLQHGYFEQSDVRGVNLTRFSQDQVYQRAIEFIQDGTANAPSYRVAVSDGKVTTSPQASTIIFNAAPVLTYNQLTLDQGQTVIITPNDLSATDQDTSASDLLFTASGVTHGHFEDSSIPGANINRFLQQRILAGAMKFIADGSIYPPFYNISVSDGSLTTTPSPAIINFSLQSATAIAAASNTVRNAIIGGTVSGGLGLLFLFLKLYLTHKSTKNLQKALAGSEMDVTRPIANKIFERIDLIGPLGYCSEKKAHAYLKAIEIVINNVKTDGINLDLKSMQPFERNALLKIIATQTRKMVVKKHSLCSRATLFRFFTSETTPQQISQQSAKIAAAVKKTYNARIHGLRTSPLREREEMIELQAWNLGDRKQRPDSETESLNKLKQSLNSKLDAFERRLNERINKTKTRAQILLDPNKIDSEESGRLVV